MTNENITRLEKLSQVRSGLNNLTMELVTVDPWVNITFGTANYKLEYSFGAVMEVFRKTGKNVNMGEVTPEITSDVSILPALLLAGLRTHHEADFPEGDAGELKVAKMMRMKHVSYYQACIAKAMDAAQPDKTRIMEIMKTLDESEDEQMSLPLPQTSTSQDSGHNVEILDAPIGSV